MNIKIFMLLIAICAIVNGKTSLASCIFEPHIIKQSFVEELAIPLQTVEAPVIIRNEKKPQKPPKKPIVVDDVDEINEQFLKSKKNRYMGIPSQNAVKSKTFKGTHKLYSQMLDQLSVSQPLGSPLIKQSEKKPKKTPKKKLKKPIVVDDVDEKKLLKTTGNPYISSAIDRKIGRHYSSEIAKESEERETALQKEKTADYSKRLKDMGVEPTEYKTNHRWLSPELSFIIELLKAHSHKSIAHDLINKLSTPEDETQKQVLKYDLRLAKIRAREYLCSAVEYLDKNLNINALQSLGLITIVKDLIELEEKIRTHKNNKGFRSNSIKRLIQKMEILIDD